MTAGSVLFAGTSGVISQNNGNLFYDNTNTRLGINAGTSPAYTLSVGGTGNFTGALTGTSLALSTTLGINNGTAGTSYIQFNYNPVDARCKSWRLWNDQYQYGDFAISQATTQGGSTYADKFVISTLGDVLINDSSINDYAKLQVTATSGVVLGLANPSAAAAGVGNVIQFWGTSGYNTQGEIATLWDGASNGYAYMTFKTRGPSLIERMRITSGGFLKASNTGTYLSATGTYYEFNSDLNSIVQLWNITNASYADDVHQIRVTRAATSAYYFGSYYSGTTSDKEFGFRGDGVGYSDGGWTTPASDYAEYFESIDGTALPIGSTVSLVGNKIKIADDGETIIGVIRPKDAQLFLGNNASEKWNQKYLKNDYGSYLKDENGERILNPDYDSNIEYTPRENRPEWNIIGLMGQVPIKKGQPTNSNWVKMKDISKEVELWLIK
jgi:hypothetical protein